MEFNTFYGTDEETYFVNSKGAVLCVQSPDLVGVRKYSICLQLPEKAEALESAVDVLDSLSVDAEEYEEWQRELPQQWTAKYLYDAALENARMHKIEFTAEYVREYADAFGQTFSDAVIDKMVASHKEWVDAGRGQDDYYQMIVFPLREIEAA